MKPDRTNPSFPELHMFPLGWLVFVFLALERIFPLPLVLSLVLSLETGTLRGMDSSTERLGP